MVQNSLPSHFDVPPGSGKQLNVHANSVQFVYAKHYVCSSLVMCEVLLMRENYGGRLALKQMKIPPEIVYSLDMNGYEIGEGNFHGDKDVNGEDCDGFERDFHCNASDEDGEIFAGDDDGADDVYRQLAQKEKDLLLAAELGKALLEKNEELSQKYELLQEEYSQAVEVRFCCFFVARSAFSFTRANEFVESRLR